MYDKRHWVLDTNILVSTLIKPYGNEANAIRKARASGTILISERLQNEYFGIISRKKFDKYISFESRLEFFETIIDSALIIHPSISLNFCRDPKDNMLLELALEAGADGIITGDHDLLVLHPFQNIPIITASEFMKKAW
jgi:uncharacterized protein